jgi:membrane-associated PAP2 superfamily phosphatase
MEADRSLYVHGEDDARHDAVSGVHRNELGTVGSSLKRSLSRWLEDCEPLLIGASVFITPDPLAQHTANSFDPRHVSDHPTFLTVDRAQQDVLVLLVGLAALALWEWSRLDLPLARLYATTAGFEWRHHWLTAKVLHDGARLAGWAFLFVVLASVWRPRLLVAAVPRRERIWWILTTLACVALIPLMKRASATSCPWSLIQFGGEFARYVPHWVVGLQDGGPGGCFPSGHASTAFAMLPGWFALRDYAPRIARIFLAVVVLCGWCLAWVQMMRGAHFLSHSLWTAFICWTVSVISWHGLQARREGRQRGVKTADEERT